MREIKQSGKLQHVRYDVRGQLLEEAGRLEAEGHKILKLNVGNPAMFGFDAPGPIVNEMIDNLASAQGYSDSQGIFSARAAVAQYYQSQGVVEVDPADVFLGNGVSELITLVLQALVDNGDEILVPAPDYPLWTGAVILSGGKPVHYRCDEEAGWMPDLVNLESKITARTRALVMINPNNPTGAVYSKQTVADLIEIARRHDLIVLSDEIYEKIIFDGLKHHFAARHAADDVLCLTFSGLSKAYRVCGYRAGWVLLSGPRHRARSFIEGMTLLANMRMCANVPGQYAIQAALGGTESIGEYLVPGGRLYEQSKTAWSLLNKIEGVTCSEPHGALYCFPKLDRSMFGIDSDESFALDLLRTKKLLVTHGTGFNWTEPDHFRLVTLPDVTTLADAVSRIADYLAAHRR